MKTSVIEKAKKIIDERRFNAENIAVSNKIEALKDGTFKKLYQDYTSKMIDYSRQGRELPKEVKAEKSKYLKRLEEIGVGSIEPNYSCKKCNDTGYIDGLYCACLVREINNNLKQESGFDKLEDFDKTDFSIFENADFMKKLYQKMKEWCHSKFDKTLIYIAGDTGVGKTHLIKCMANELIKLSHVVLLTSSFAMHQDFVKSYSTRDLDEKSNLLDRYLNSEILFIDDLGTELRQPNITINYLYQVINERKMKRLPTVITSNLDLYEIKDYYDERISSRIIDKASSICVYVKGKDIRLNQKNN